MKKEKERNNQRQSAFNFYAKFLHAHSKMTRSIVEKCQSVDDEKKIRCRLANGPT